MSGANAWWRETVVYHIYPRGFQHSDGDGDGDLRGILDRLYYLNDGSERSPGRRHVRLLRSSPRAEVRR